MRILLTTDLIGGVWTYSKELVRGFLAKGHAVALVSFGSAPSRQDVAWCQETREKHGQTFECHLETVPLEWMAENNRALCEGEAILARVADGFRPDILHSNQFCYGTSSACARRLVAAHSDVLSWAEACEPAGLPETPWITTYRKIVQAGLEGAEMVVAPTAWMLRALEKNFALPHRTGVIPNGREVFPLDLPRKLQAATAGRMWDPAKNLKLLQGIEAMPVVVAGRTDERSEGASTSSQLRFAGHLDEPDLIRLFSESAVSVATSVYEPFGLTAVEAALCGCAVLLKDIPSFREVWGHSALYFDSATELETHLRRLLAAPEELRALQQSSRARAQRYTAEGMVSQYLSVYSEMLGSAAACETEAYVH